MLSIAHAQSFPQDMPGNFECHSYAQEVLQGASSPRDFKKLAAHFSTLRIFQPVDEIKTYEKAARLYFTCRQEGVTIRSTIDCLIAQIAIEHKLTLVHSDKDYERIANLAPLKLA